MRRVDRLLGMCGSRSGYQAGDIRRAESGSSEAGSVCLVVIERRREDSDESKIHGTREL